MSLPDSEVLLQIACFSCRGTLTKSYLKTGHFKMFINSELRKTLDSNIEFFGKMFPVSSCMWINMKQLFIEIKRNFFIVKGIAVDNIDSLKQDFNFVSVESVRMSILKVLQFFLANLQELSLSCPSFNLISHSISAENNHLKQMLIQLISEIKTLLVYVGRISNIQGIVNIKDFSNDTGKSAANFYHYYHLCLDIWYNCFAIIYNIYFMIPDFDIKVIFCDEFIDQSNGFMQLSSLLLYEFSSIAINRYKHANIYSNSPFLCPCIRDFWIMLIYLIDKSNAFIEEASFWSAYLSIFQIILKNASSLSVNEELTVDMFCLGNIPLHKENTLEACLWLISHIAPLFKYNTLGSFCEYMKAKSGYANGKYLVHNLLNSPIESAERNLRNSLYHCIQVIKLWETSSEILLLLTDFFVKKIEDTFSIQSNELGGLSYLFQNTPSWFNYISNLSNSTLVGKVSSFDCFLCILQFQLELDSDNSLWRSLKGRVYSKFTPRKIKEISEIGLQNIFSIFLAIAASGQFEITGKICEVISVIETAAYPRKQIISWKALFVLLYICQEKKQDMQNIVKLISKFFDSACSDYAKISKDSMHRNNIMHLLLIYIDNMNEIFKRNKCLNLSQYDLITAGFSELFSTCSVTEINYILSVFHSILQRMHTATQTHTMDFVTNEAQCIRIIQVLFKNIFPFIENIATTDTPPLVVSDIAIVLTKLTYDFSSSLDCTQCDYQKIFIYFGCKRNVNCAISCRYLCFILDCSNLMNDLKLKITDLNVLLMQSWFKCTIYIHTRCDDIMQELTQKVIITEMIKIVPDINTLNLYAGDHVKTSIEFYRLIGNEFAKSTSQQKTQMAIKVQQIFKSFAFFAMSKIQKGKDSPSLTHVYKLLSHLVEHCSVVLHLNVSLDNVLLQLLRQTVYPHVLFPSDKALQSLVSCSVKEYLPLFMRGLFKLDYRQDKSVQKEIKNISIYYLAAFLPSNNPLMKLVIDSVTRKPEGLTLDAYEFMLEMLKSSLLSNSVDKPISIFEFYQEVFRLTPPACKKEISNILLKCAMEIFMKQNDSLSESLKVLIRKTVIYFKEKMPLSHTKLILTPIVQWFIQEKLQWSVVRGFSVLDIFVEHLPYVISDIVPFLTKSVETLEKHRGLGEDMLLRNGLRNVVTKLQQKLSVK